MAHTQKRNVERAIGIIAMVTAILILLGEFAATPATVDRLFLFLVTVLLVVGILVLANVLPSSNSVGGVFIVLGVLLFFSSLGFFSFWTRVVDLVVVVVLVIVGIRQLT